MPKAPLFANNWYGDVPGDELRQEVQNTYESMEEAEALIEETREEISQEIQELEQSKAPLEHTHVEEDITDLGDYWDNDKVDHDETPSWVQSDWRYTGHLRLPNGVQMCWGEVYLGTRTEFGSGSANDPYRTNVEDVTFPVTFRHPPTVQIAPRVETTTGRRRAMTVSYYSKSTTQITRIQASALSDADNADDVWAEWFAIGTYTV